jgi:aromatic-L-amino-acid decarboxylase
MAGSAAICPEYRFIQEGLEHAQSYCFNPHKFLLTNFDCSCFYVSDKDALIDSFSITPEYLKTKASESNSVFDYRDWQIPLGRRFRSLKLWSVIRYYGTKGMQAHIRQHMESAKALTEKINKDDRFELMAPTVLNLVCFRYKGSDDFNETLVQRLNDSGKLYLIHTKLNNKYTLRFSIGQTKTTWDHIIKAWELILQETEVLEKEKIS